MSAGLTLDAGALIQLEKGQARVRALLRLAHDDGRVMAVPAPVVAQVWRGGSGQAVIARLIASPDVEVVPLDLSAAHAVGVLCGRARTRDVVDASVVVCARERGDAIVTTDERDLRRLDPGADLIVLGRE